MQGLKRRLGSRKKTNSEIVSVNVNFTNHIIIPRTFRSEDPAFSIGVEQSRFLTAEAVRNGRWQERM
jgi:hypothetical protein